MYKFSNAEHDPERFKFRRYIIGRSIDKAVLVHSSHSLMSLAKQFTSAHDMEVALTENVSKRTERRFFLAVSCSSWLAAAICAGIGTV